MASQPAVGLLSERRAGTGPGDSDHPAALGSDLIYSQGPSSFGVTRYRHCQALESIAVNVYLKSTEPNSAEPEVPIAVCIREQGGAVCL